MQPVITPCSSQDLDKLDKQQIFALQRLQMIAGVGEFTGTESDFEWMQAGLDSGELDHQVDLQCLGVPLGHIIINNIDGFAWWMLEDDLGITPCIRYRESNLLIFPLTLISKRIELGETVNIASLYQDLLSRVTPLRQQLDIELNSSSSKIH